MGPRLILERNGPMMVERQRMAIIQYRVVSWVPIPHGHYKIHGDWYIDVTGGFDGHVMGVSSGEEGKGTIMMPQFKMPCLEMGDKLLGVCEYNAPSMEQAVLMFNIKWGHNSGLKLEDVIWEVE